MFSTLESNWDQSARRKWTLASFTIQVWALGILLAISLLWVERPPQVHWLQLPAPAAFAPSAPIERASERHATIAVRNTIREPIIAPRSIPLQTAVVNDADADSGPPAPDLPAFGAGRGSAGDVSGGLGDSVPVVIPRPPAAVRPLVVSHLTEADVLHRVQPIYPPLARQARVQGRVELRAIISKAGTIEHLAVVSGHPMLAAAAIEAVRQWRYRPYLLNSEPVEVETEITVNFLLSGN